MDTALKELGYTFQTNFIQDSVTVDKFKPDIFGNIPVDHWSYPPEFAAGYFTAIKTKC
jgi:hypothetical protein